VRKNIAALGGRNSVTPHWEAVASQSSALQHCKSVLIWRPASVFGRLPNVKSVTAMIVALLALLGFALRAGENKVDVSKIHGRIQYVSSFPDYKVQAVTSFPDLRVQIVKSFPDKPGRWEIVDSFPDYKIQMVQSFPDFTIEFVESFPGPAK
jgi:hypothetical protein